MLVLFFNLHYSDFEHNGDIPNFGKGRNEHATYLSPTRYDGNKMDT